MNSFIRAQLQRMIVMAGMMKQSCEIAAKQDDGVVSRDEAKLIKKVNEATDRYTKELTHILEKE